MKPFPPRIYERVIFYHEVASLPLKYYKNFEAALAVFFFTQKTLKNCGVFYETLFEVYFGKRRTLNGKKENAGKQYWEDKEYSYFSHKKCEFFPCHKGADPEDFNCLFCYCPLYALGDKCGGNFRYTEKGIKDCTNCQLPHKKKNYGYVTGKYQELADLMRKIKENNDF